MLGSVYDSIELQREMLGPVVEDAGAEIVGPLAEFGEPLRRHLHLEQPEPEMTPRRRSADCADDGAATIPAGRAAGVGVKSAPTSLSQQRIRLP
jgi:hypothetical protein